MTGVFEGVGTLQFSPDNKFCYAYSGTKTTDGTVWDANIELLNFTTGSEYIIAKFYMTSNMITGNNLFVRIKLNDTTVLDLKTDGNPPLNPDFRDYELVIPPFTEVDFLFGSQGIAATATGFLSGKVKGAVEQENLESITNNNKWASK